MLHSKMVLCLTLILLAVKVTTSAVVKKDKKTGVTGFKPLPLPSLRSTTDNFKTFSGQLECDLCSEKYLKMEVWVVVVVLPQFAELYCYAFRPWGCEHLLVVNVCLHNEFW